MTIVSTKEFNAHQEKYLDIAINEKVYIQRDDFMFMVTKTTEPARIYKEPDEDLCRAITMEELRTSAHEHIHKLFANQ